MYSHFWLKTDLKFIHHFAKYTGSKCIEGTFGFRPSLPCQRVGTPNIWQRISLPPFHPCLGVKLNWLWRASVAVPKVGCHPNMHATSSHLPIGWESIGSH
ncbi:unnamed protein product [Urochloa humidicola]